ncbi:histidine biosynthesis bifunctional protein HisIE [Shewanella sp. NFH-SH190041]|uniref:bifunctional phosphoribosyl-AMP cyclohydrolase/phosphoribosyl-ATP diphosphatase HisIE n=1 Tax=Shewanella sp. NFH-SH190041 TaxID=2950245 RepID=UPI0021C2CB34|nr:bifunctional phosphoribosyl-AMP cyclohydrolase/phosphoribosyl-ATP diphosphatase HisIE [Shewanella sp. NFH-SH190041]BDM64835.1 histidine biosynthesis bifunctional protein HisIE [Shewanella sp. NFH-SH190041]
MVKTTHTADTNLASAEYHPLYQLPVNCAENLAEHADFNKTGGLLPAVIQDTLSGTVLMLGYMNHAALEQTINSGWVTFFSRSKQRLWQKGEGSGNKLRCLSIALDCDNDALLLQALPLGPTCHTGAQSCWHDNAAAPFSEQLTRLIRQRHLQLQRTGSDASQFDPSTEATKPSYTESLFQAGSKRIAQKVGEEGVETALAAAVGDKAELVNEAADLLYHLQVLLEDQALSLSDVQKVLLCRHSNIR